jgi:hypothetical protein
MPLSRQFEIGFTVTKGAGENLFLSVSEGFEHGPGIQRDGISDPRMTDPHSVAAVVNRFRMDGRAWKQFPPTTNAYVQRAGTWTLYHHLKRFQTRYGAKWRIAGVQSNGDLTMNFWHIAFLNRDGVVNLCGLRTQGDPQEPIARRIYRCLVKWLPAAAQVRGIAYEFLDVVFEALPDERWMVKLGHPEMAEGSDAWLSSVPGYDAKVRDIGPFIEFALSGKPIVENGVEITLANAIDRFEDVRHVFNLPMVKAIGHYNGYNVGSINFGEFQLYRNVNERRAALTSPVVIGLKIDGYVTTKWEQVRETLRKRHYRETSESPTRRGQFRRYSDDSVEIFFPHNVYPFGVLGLRPSESDPDHGRDIVGLSSGGLSGRVGNTLEGTTQIMFDFFGCTDAIVLDEGYDVFALANPERNGIFAYSNDEILAKVLAFTRQRVDADAADAAKSAEQYPLGAELRKWPLNESLMAELDDDFSKAGHVDHSDVVIVPPNRSQMRSVLILAVEEESRLTTST